MLNWDDEPKPQSKPTNTEGPTPVNVDDKRVINGETDINQLAPFKYPWAWEYFMNANKNHWTPLDVNMAQDVHDYHHRLNPAEKHVYENVLAYLTTSDILAMRNIGLAVMEKMSAPELQIYQARQVYEEAMHTWAYQHCIETLNLDQSEIYNRYRVVPAINGKIQMANRRLDAAMRSDMNLRNRDDLQEFIMSYLFFAAVFEGAWFYNGFSPIFARSWRKRTSPSTPKPCATCGTSPKLPSGTTPTTSCGTRSWGTPPNTTTNSSASWPTAAHGRSAWKNPSPGRRTSPPGWTNRPPCARRRTSSRPG